MSFLESVIWYSSDLLVDLAGFLIQEPFIYIVALVIMFYIAGIVKRLMSA